MLDMLNDIQVRRTDIYNQTRGDYIVPIEMSYKDKAYTFSKQDTEDLISGNINVLPRMSLSLGTMVKSADRNTNKYKMVKRDIGNDKIQFQYNYVPYDYYFDLDIATLTLTDMSMIVEQIVPLFNPTYALKVNELDYLEEPTSINVGIETVSIDIPEIDEGYNIITGNISFVLKGHMYPPIKDGNIIEQIKIITRAGETSSFENSSLITGDITTSSNNIGIEYVPHSKSDNTPVISSIYTESGLLETYENENLNLEVIFVDKDSFNFSFVWSIVSGNGSVGTASNKVVFAPPINVDSDETTTIQIIIIDEFGLQSEPFLFDILVKNKA